MIAAIYARKSTDQGGIGDEQKSVARQVEHARAFAARKGWAVADEHVYVDDAVSGAEFERRPGFVRLMAALTHRPPFDVLVMSEESRLGREMLQTGYALYKLAAAGVRVWYYLDDRERTLDSPTDKILVSLQGFADEMERVRARQRAHDALKRKALAGHVTGGRVFGYRNVEIGSPDATGRTVRQFVKREILESEAAVVRLIFERYAAGVGLSTLTKQLNAEGQPCPRPQQGRPAGWAPSSVREILLRPLYRGAVSWNRTQKRTPQGIVRQRPRPEADWIGTSAPELRIVDDATWQTVQARFAAREHGKGGRPAGSGAKYLLTGLMRCVCGSSFEAMSRKLREGRVFYYGCAAHRHRGTHVCPNGLTMPMALAERAVLDVVVSDLLSLDVVVPAIERALARVEQSIDPAGEHDVRRVELDALQDELSRLAAAVAAGGNLSALVDAIRTREARRAVLAHELATIARPAPAWSLDAVRRELAARLRRWRRLLRVQSPAGRQALRALIPTRLTFTPDAEARLYTFSGAGTLGPIVGSLDVWGKIAVPVGDARFLPTVPISGEVRLSA